MYSKNVVLGGETVSAIIGPIIGAFIAGVIGIVIVYYTKNIEEKRIKKCISKALVIEIELHQKPLTDLVEYGKMWHEIVDGSDNLSGKFDFRDFPNELHFDQTLYSALTDKIGFLDSKNSENLVLYYAKIKIMEDQYKQLKTRHNLTGYALTRIKEQYGTWTDGSTYPLRESYLGAAGDKNLPISEIEGFLTKVEKTFDLGTDLMESLKE